MRMQRKDSLQVFERPQTSVGRSVPTTARRRFVQHCHAVALPPEPLIIARNIRQRTNQLMLPHYGIGNKCVAIVPFGCTAFHPCGLA